MALDESLRLAQRHWRAGGAFRPRVGAARMEMTARRRTERVREAAAELEFRQAQAGVRRQDRTQQRLGVGVAGFREHLARRAVLDDAGSRREVDVFHHLIERVSGFGVFTKEDLFNFLKIK